MDLFINMKLDEREKANLRKIMSDVVHNRQAILAEQGFVSDDAAAPFHAYIEELLTKAFSEGRQFD